MPPPRPAPSSSPSGEQQSIKLRFATYIDLWPAAQLLGRAFFDDVLFGQHIHPFRSSYPSDVGLYWYRPFQSHYWDPAVVFLLSVDLVDNHEIITGVAQWHRLGPSASRYGWSYKLGRLDPRTLLLPWFFRTVVSKLSSLFRPNRAADPALLDVLDRAEPFTDHIFNDPARQEHWYLHFLGVDPGHQGRGIGRELVKWGLDQARKEGVAACVVAGYKRERFYERCGFTTSLGTSGMGEGNPIADIPGGVIYWVGPEELEKK